MRRRGPGPVSCDAMDILLIPGFMLDRELWSELRPRLAAQGRVIDADTTQDRSIDAIADRAIATLSGPTMVVGFSMGGYVARSIAYRAPEKVERLVLIATSSRSDFPAQQAPPPIAFRRLSRAAVAGSLHPAHRTDALIAHVQAMSERLGNVVYQRQRLIEREDDTARLAQIRCPTLVIAAAQDELRTLTESQVLRDGIAGARLLVIEDSGHLIPLEQPDALAAALLAFVSSADPLPAS